MQMSMPGALRCPVLALHFRPGVSKTQVNRISYLWLILSNISLICYFICPLIRYHCLGLKMCLKMCLYLSQKDYCLVYQAKGLKVCGVSAFQLDHIFECDLMSEQPCCWIKIPLHLMVIFMNDFEMRTFSQWLSFQLLLVCSHLKWKC